MTLTPHEAAVSQLGSSYPPAERIESLRFIKNNIIGNKTKKDLYIRLGVISRLRDIITVRDEKDPQLKTQAVIVLGSFAFGNESNILELVNSGVMGPVLNCLNPSGDPKLIEAAARTLNAIFTSPKVSRQELFVGNHLNVMVQLLDVYSTSCYMGREAVLLHTAELVASIFAKCCEAPEHQIQIAESGAIPLLMRLLASGVSKSQEAALGALAALVKDNHVLAEHIAQTRMEKGERPAPYILQLVRDKSPTMRLAAITCLAYMDRVNVIREHSHDIQSIVLPKLVKMLQLTGVVQETAPKVLAHLIWESESMQVEVCKLDAIPKLASIISQVDEEDNVYGIVGRKDKLKKNSLLALAAISQMKEDCREKVIEAKVLPHIVRAMSHPSVGVRAAACQCTRSLSRSVKNLRTDLVDAGIETPLFELLNDSDPGVLSSATATLCNIVLDVCPMRKSFMERGIVAKFVQMIGSGDSNVRLNALWAIKNLVFEAKSELKETVMSQFGYNTLSRLLNDDEHLIQEQALNLVRNLACKRERDIEQVFTGLGNEQLMDAIEKKLKGEDQRLLEHALYVLVNISTGSEQHKQSVVKRRNILELVIDLMSHRSVLIRVATVWVVINLTWPDLDASNGVHERVMELRDLGAESKLQSLTMDQELDVRERVKTALHHFQMDHQQHPHTSSSSSGSSSSASTSNSASNSIGAGTSANASQGQRMSVESAAGPTASDLSFLRPILDPAAATAGVSSSFIQLRMRLLQSPRDPHGGGSSGEGGSAMDTSTSPASASGHDRR
ncbi:MAG: armadillo-type protein [Benniella sp.]|nr:MAG: armadillo-type protein [Benniella sp.]